MAWEGSVDVKERVNVDIGCEPFRVAAMGPKVDSSAMMRQRGSNYRVAILRAIYSASVVGRAISVWSLLAQVMGQPQ